MAYIGREPQIGNFQVCDAITVVDAQAAYTMQVGGVNVSPETANHMLVSLNGILQAPTSSYTVAGSTITFAANLVTGDVINFIQILGSVLDLGVPSDATVSTAKIVDANVTAAKMFSGFANGITMADTWRLTADFSGATDPISSNLEQNDDASFQVIGTPMSVSSGIFTFPETGKYYITATFQMYNTSSETAGYIYYTVNNSSYSIGGNGTSQMASTSYNIVSTSMIFDVTNTTNCKVKFTASAGGTIMGNSGYNATHFQFIRLGDT
jgi:hypothetical protein